MAEPKTRTEVSFQGLVRDLRANTDEFEKKPPIGGLHFALYVDRTEKIFARYTDWTREEFYREVERRRKQAGV